MQIVIDIPSKWFDDMVREKFTEVDELCAVIQHGTLLPKGHGDLKDADAIMSTIKENLQIRPEFAIEHSPTIIEADRSEEE